jgi:hypothetical protein
MTRFDNTGISDVLKKNRFIGSREESPMRVNSKDNGKKGNIDIGHILLKHFCQKEK